MSRPPRRTTCSLVLASAVAALLVSFGGSPTFGAFTAAVSTNATATVNPTTCWGAGQVDSAALLYGLGASSSRQASTGTSTTNETFNNSLSQDSAVGCTSDKTNSRAYPNASKLSSSVGYALNPISMTSSTAEFSIEAWFKTSASPGQIAGLESDNSPSKGDTADHQLFVDTNGKVDFAVGASTQLVSTTTVTNGAWHDVVGTVGPAGTFLYLDGNQVASSTNVKGDTYPSSYLMIGQGQLGNWANTGSPGSSHNATPYFTGSLQFVAIYPSQLNATQVLSHYRAATGG